MADNRSFWLPRNTKVWPEDMIFPDELIGQDVSIVGRPFGRSFVRVPFGHRKSSDKLIQAYEQGFTGTLIVPGAKEAFLDQCRQTGGYSKFEDVAHAYGFADSYAGQLVIPYIWMMVFWPGCLPGAAQQRGDCFAPGTMVSGDKIQPIESVRIGDKVWNAKGELTEVVSIRSLVTMRPMVEVHSVGMTPLRCTADHKLWVYRLKKVAGRRINPSFYQRAKSGADHLTKENTATLVKCFEEREAQWVPAGDLTDTDLLLSPVSYERIERPASPFGILDSADGRFFVGCFLGNGYSGKRSMCLATPHDHIANRLVDFLVSVSTGKCRKEWKKGCWQIRVHNQKLCSWLRESFYDHEKAKSFPGWAVGDVDVLNGLRATDGFDRGGSHFLDSTSKSIIYGAYATLCQEGYEPTVAVLSRSKGTYANAKPLLRMIWREDKKKQYCWRDDKYVCRPVTKIKFIEGPQVVYDIGIKDRHHSFLANGVISHNCVSHAESGAQRLTIAGDIASLMPDEITKKLEWIPAVDPIGIKNGVTSSEFAYWWRGYNGDGWDCPTAGMVGLNRGCMLRNNYEGIVDLRVYSGSLAGKYGSRQPPDEIANLGAQHKLHTASDASSFEAIRDALGTLRGVQTCGGQGFSSQRGQYAESRRSGSWSHGFKIIGADDRDIIKQIFKEPMVLCDNNWGCFDDQTEVLTESGWKQFADVTQDDKIATLNQQTHMLEYHRASQQHTYDYSGYLWHYKWQGVDQLVTPNHKLYFAKANQPADGVGSWGLGEAQKTTGRIRFKKDAQWSGPEVLQKKIGKWSVPMDLWLEFMGYFLSEGSTTERVKVRKLANGGVSRFREKIVSISQEKPDGVRKMKILMDRLPWRMRRTKSGWTTSGNVALFDELRGLGKAHEKFVPEELKCLSRRQITILLDAMMIGDGGVSKTPTGDLVRYYTSSGRLAGDVQELALKAGFCADDRQTNRVGRDNGSGGITRYVEHYVCLKRKRVSPAPRNASECTPRLVPYEGKVYCLTVPNHVMYVRRNGVACWSGNSWNGGNRDIYQSASMVPALQRIVDKVCGHHVDLVALDIVNGQTGNIMVPPGSWFARWSEIQNRDYTVHAGIQGWARPNLENWGAELAG